MMLRSIFLKSLRDNRAGVLGWGAGFGFIMLVGAAQYPQVIGGAGEMRARMAAEMAKAFQAFSFMLGEITALDTIGGFLTTRILGFVPVMLALWIAVVAIGLIRGEEQQGALDMLLSTPHSRLSVLREKVAALLVVIVAAIAFLSLGLFVGILASGEPLPAIELALAMLNIAAIMAFWAAVGLLVGQLVLVRRTASSITGGIIFGTFLLNNLLEGLPNLKWLGWLMPFHYYSVSKPLVPGRVMEWGAWLALMAFTAGALLMAGLLFVRRDIGSTFRIFPSRAGTRAKEGASTLLGSVFGKSIRDLLWPTFFWSLGLGLYALMLVSTVNEVLGPLRQMLSNGDMGLIGAIIGNMSTPEAYVSYSLFTYLPALLSAFAITQVEGWASDEEEGRLEVLAAMPLPRWQLIAARYAAILLSLLVILGALGAALLLGAAASGVTLDTSRMWGALGASLPLGMVVAAFGLCVAAWLKRPGVAMPVTIGIVVAMFFLELFAPLLGLPDAVLNLSIFHLYGKPMIQGIQWGGTLALVAATLLLAAGSLVGLKKRDIAK
ncbi:MAG TPA: ABC transporter permease subunit [Chloroflexia bacterium]|jgi:ABC-2 type transport system permease protein